MKSGTNMALDENIHIHTTQLRSFWRCKCHWHNRDGLCAHRSLRWRRLTTRDKWPDESGRLASHITSNASQRVWYRCGMGPVAADWHTGDLLFPGRIPGLGWNGSRANQSSTFFTDEAYR